MKTRLITLKHLCLLSVILLAWNTVLNGQYASNQEQSGTDRWGTGEFYLGLTLFTAPDLKVNNITVPGVGTHDGIMTIDDSVLYGMGFGYGLTERLNLNGEINIGSVDYDMQWGDYSMHGKGDLFTTRINLDYYFLKTALTPYVTGGFGYSYFDSGIPTGETDIICWWDPWWGYTCDGYVDTHTASEFTYNAGIGLRWDVNESVFIKFLYDITWMDVGDAATEMFPQYQLAGGIKW